MKVKDMPQPVLYQLKEQLRKQKDRQEELDALVKQITLTNFRNITL